MLLTPPTIFRGILVSGLCFALFKTASKCVPQFSTYSSNTDPQQIQHILRVYDEELKNSKIMDQMIPKSFENEKSLEKLTDNLYYRKQQSHLSSLTKSLSDPIWDLLERGGKRWRPALCMLIAEMQGHDRSEVFEIAAACEVIHNGTLIIDDIEDSSQIRRNKPCVHHLYGIDISLNAGNFMYYAPMLHLLKCGKFSSCQLTKMGQIYVEEMVNLHIGQGWDILWHNVDKLEGKYPTEQQYFQMTAHKTGVLVRLATRLVCTYLNLQPKQTEILIRFAEAIGVAFQIQDDLLNLEGKKFKETKGYNGEDIHEGKISLIVIHFLQHSSLQNQTEFLTILRSRTTHSTQINRAIELLNQTESLKYAREKMQELIEDSCKKLEEQFARNDARDLLISLANFGINRDH